MKLPSRQLLWLVGFGIAIASLVWFSGFDLGRQYERNWWTNKLNAAALECDEGGE